MNLDKLAAPLEASRIKQRAAGGSKPALSYLESHDVIRTANDIFGFGKWGHEVTELRLIEAVTVHNRDQKAGTHVGYVCIVRLTVEGCVPMSGVGYGDATEYRESAAVTAHELAAKEAESDALKRALKNFGDQFGLALYDKQAASSGHVTSDKPKSAQKSAEQKNTAGWPSKAEADALLALVEEKGGGVEATRTAMEIAKADRATFPKWFAGTRAHWEKQKRPFKVPESAKAAA
jgi:DNA recombination protein Rad52